MDAVDVVLGAGAVGMAVAEAPVRRGETVRVLNRSGLREPIAGGQSATGDTCRAPKPAPPARSSPSSTKRPALRSAEGHAGMADARSRTRQPTVREINEMRYEFDEPFIVDASCAETKLGLRATPLTNAVELTVRCYCKQAIPSSTADQRGREAVPPATIRSSPQ
jgi:hypothetical protein